MITSLVIDLYSCVRYQTTLWALNNNLLSRLSGSDILSGFMIHNEINI